MIQEIKRRLSIESYLARRGVELKPSGGELVGCCPLPDHEDRNPSFSVSPDKGLWCCHSHPSGSCGGDVIKLHLLMEGFATMGEAAKDLAEHLALPLESPAPDTRKTHPPKRGKGKPLEKLAKGQWEPSAMPRPPLEHHALGRPVRTWEVRDGKGKLFAVHARFEAGDKKKVLWWRAGKWELKPWGAVDAPLWGSDRLPPGAAPVWVCEGEKAAEALREWAMAVGTCSGAAIPRARPLQVLKGRRVVLWPDKDSVGATHMRKLADALRDICREVLVLPPPAELDAKGDAWDWLDSRSGMDPEAVRRDLEALRAEAEPAFDAEPIAIDLNEHETNTQALAVVARRERNLFQRAGALVQIVADPEPRSWGRNGAKVRQDAGTARIALVEPARLREVASRHCRFLKPGKEGDWVPARVPMWLPAALMARGSWPRVRPLRAISQSPIFRPDGSIHQVGGWDRETGVYYEEPKGLRFDAVPSEPTRKQAEAARDLLLQAVKDFPFRSEADKSAWLSLVLTVAVRSAIGGTTPLYLVDATTPGSGKGLLIEAAALITTGHSVALAGWPSKGPEQEKLITALLLEGASFVSFDNVRGFLGGPELDRLLTAKRWRGRILGRTQTVELPNTTIWCATGNNVEVGGDTSRRALQIRLEPQTDRPELRVDFDHPNLPAWILQERAKLLPAALTILREFWREVEPHERGVDQLSQDLIDSGLPPFGMAEEWSSIIRRMLVRLDLPDPAETREELRQGASEIAGLAALIAGLETFLAEQGETKATAAQLAAADGMQSVWGELMGVEKGKSPNSRRVGKFLAKHAGRWADGKRIRKAGSHAKVTSWAVDSNTDVAPEIGSSTTDLDF